jgi:hypothetical protein
MAKVGGGDVSITRVALPLVFSFVLGSTVSLAQNNCPEGFRYAGTLSGHGSSVDSFDSRQALTLPQNAKFDESYQQKKVDVTNGKNGVHSNMRPQDVPKGFYLVPYGDSSSTIDEAGWAVSDPKLRALSRDASGKVTRYGFGMRLLCSARAAGAERAVECSVRVDVCYKPLR